jgi:hypothetical protein
MHYWSENESVFDNLFLNEKLESGHISLLCLRKSFLRMVVI